jgi:hypothetical protein
MQLRDSSDEGRRAGQGRQSKATLLLRQRDGENPLITNGQCRLLVLQTEIMTKNLWKKHTDKVGVVGSMFTGLCCLGVPALLSILSAIGLGFLME